MSIPYRNGSEFLEWMYAKLLRHLFRSDHAEIIFAGVEDARCPGFVEGEPRKGRKISQNAAGKPRRTNDGMDT